MLATIAQALAVLDRTDERPALDLDPVEGDPDLHLEAGEETILDAWERIDAHLAACPRCRRRWTEEMSAGAADAPLPDDLRARLNAIGGA